MSGYAYSKVVPGQTYRFAVQAVNKFGAQLSDNCVQINVLNTTKPAPPASLDASGSATNVYPTVANGIQLYWPATATNATDDTTCADGSTKKETNIPFGENLAYVVLRSTDPAFKSTDAGVTVLPAAPSAAPGGLLTWTDTAIGNCKNYYYRIKSYSVPCGQTGNGARGTGRLFVEKQTESADGNDRKDSRLHKGGRMPWFHFWRSNRQPTRAPSDPRPNPLRSRCGADVSAQRRLTAQSTTQA